jgi:hypothetical protein
MLQCRLESLEFLLGLEGKRWLAEHPDGLEPLMGSLRWTAGDGKKFNPG